MREIKFRAWDTRGIKGKMVIMSPTDNPFTSSDLIEEDDWKVMQFTGLHDKNGKEIYEGDIIRVQVNQHIWLHQIGCVESEGANLHAIQISDNVTIDGETDRYTYQMTNERAGQWRPIPMPCEVIGNIYENLELLEGGK